MGYGYLFAAIVAEVIATSALKAAEGFTVLLPSVAVVFGYVAAFYFLSLALHTIPMGTAYAIWSSAGVVLISIIGAFLYHQRLDWAALVGIAMIVGGVVVIRVFSRLA